MANYAAKHAQAYARLAKDGAEVTFKAGSEGTYNPDGSWTDNAVANVAGNAAELPGEVQEYEALELIGKDAVTLLFVPATIGQLPGLGYAATWRGKTRTVRRVAPIAPAGVAIMARVVLA